MRYEIIFTDNTRFLGGRPENSKWNLIPNKPIKKLIYHLRRNDVILSGYERYNVIKEQIRILNRAGQLITKLFIMGTTGNETHQFIVDFQKKKCYKRKTLKDCEYKSKSISGWKKGIEKSKALMKVT